MICHGAMKFFISEVRTYCCSNFRVKSVALFSWQINKHTGTVLIIRGWTSNWWGTCLARSIFLKQYPAAEMKHSAFEGAFHSTKTFENLETASNGTEISRKSFQKCWISEMRTTQPKNSRSKVEWKENFREKNIPRIVILYLEKYNSRGFPLFWKFGKCCSIRYWKLLKIQTRRFGWIESAGSPVFPEIRVPFRPSHLSGFRGRFSVNGTHLCKW